MSPDDFVLRQQKWKTTRHRVNNDHCTSLNEMINNPSNVKNDVLERVDGRIGDVLERCMTICGKAAGMKTERRSRARKEASTEEEEMRTIC